MTEVGHDDLAGVQARLSGSLGLPLSELSFVKDNGICRIYQARTSGEPVIVKQYRGDDATLARREAAALDLYARVCGAVPEAIPARTVTFNPATNTLCMTFVHGRPLSEALERAAQSQLLRRRCIRAAEHLGVVLGRLHDTTSAPGASPSPFLYEYLSYVSNGLERLPVLGRTLFRGYGVQAEVLWRDLLRAGEPPSSCHGDLALTNIRIAGDRVGLIDFANTNERSHMIGDVYGLTVYLLTKRLPAAFRQAILDALYRGIGPRTFPEPVRRFHWEMQRRRWLFLKLVAGGGAAQLHGLKALTELGPPRCGARPASLPA